MQRAIVLLLLLSSPAAAQVQNRPTDPPLVTAANESWYLLGEPLQFGGELFYRAGAAVFFNGNTMVRIGHYNGVPMYADTTVEPFSIILVPVTSGLLQPYERLRRGELAGTTGSRAPAFPVAPIPETASLPMAAAAPTALPLPIGAISVYTPTPGAALTGTPRQSDVAGPAAPAAIPSAQQTPPAVTLRAPESNAGVWLRFRERTWVSAGPAVPLTGSEFVRDGEYAGFPVFRRPQAGEDVIYLPTRSGLVAPYRAKP
jgi:hypothetical protein